MRICGNNPVPLLTGEKNKVRLPSEEVAMATSDNLLLLRSIRDCLIIAVDWCKTPPPFSIALKGLFTLRESERKSDLIMLLSDGLSWPSILNVSLKVSDDGLKIAFTFTFDPYEWILTDSLEIWKNQGISLPTPAI